MSALDKQVGGDHYKNHLIQPWMLGYAVFGGDGGAIKIAKYLTRLKDDPKLQFEKALHVGHLRNETKVPVAWVEDEMCYSERIVLDLFCKQFPEPDLLVKVFESYHATDFALCAERIAEYANAIQE